MLDANHKTPVGQAHSDPNGACRIPRRKANIAEVKKFGLPNHAGWIEPPNDIDFGKAFRDFVKKYPAYRYTMFPTRDDAGQVDEVYNNPDDSDLHYGLQREDPNYRGPDDVYSKVNSDVLPWPPYEGTVIPIFQEDEQDADKRAASSWKPGAVAPSSTSNSRKVTPPPGVTSLFTSNSYTSPSRAKATSSSSTRPSGSYTRSSEPPPGVTSLFTSDNRPGSSPPSSAFPDVLELFGNGSRSKGPPPGVTSLFEEKKPYTPTKKSKPADATRRGRALTTPIKPRVVGQPPPGYVRHTRSAPRLLNQVLVENVKRKRFEIELAKEDEDRLELQRSRATKKARSAAESSDEEANAAAAASTTETGSDSEPDAAARSKRGSDATYLPPHTAELEPEEETSESGAAPDPPSNLRADAPKTPTKRKSPSKKKNGTSATKTAPFTPVTRPKRDTAGQISTRVSKRTRKPTAKAVAAGKAAIDPMVAAETMARNAALEAKRAANKNKTRSKTRSGRASGSTEF